MYLYIYIQMIYEMQTVNLFFFDVCSCVFTLGSHSSVSQSGSYGGRNQYC